MGVLLLIIIFFCIESFSAPYLDIIAYLDFYSMFYNNSLFNFDYFVDGFSNKGIQIYGYNDMSYINMSVS
jgi:hypothetical protein